MFRTLILLGLLSLSLTLALQVNAQQKLLSGILSSTEKDALYSDANLQEYHIYIESDTLTWLYQQENLNSDYEFKAQLVVINGELRDSLPNIGFRLRGNTSRQSAKKSFKIDVNEYVSGRRFYGVKSINLNGEHNDPSIMRAKLSWDLMQFLNTPTSRASHSKVFINGEYYGLYLSVEHIDDEFIAERFDNSDGNLYKCLWPADLTWRGDNPEEYKFMSGDRRTYELKTNEDLDDYSGLRDFIGFLEFSSNADFAAQVEDRLDVDGVLRWIAVDILTSNWDNYWHNKNNFYIYHDLKTNKIHFIPYDYDNTFGIAWDNVGWADQSPNSWTPTQESRKLVTRILAIPEYKNRLYFYLDAITKDFFNVSMMENKWNSLKNLVQSAAEEDSYRTMDYGYSVDDFNRSFTESTGNHDKYGLKPYVTERVSSLQNQLQLQAIPMSVINLNQSRELIEGEHQLHIQVSLIDDDNSDKNKVVLNLYKNDEFLRRDTVSVTYPTSEQNLLTGTAEFSIPITANDTYTYFLSTLDDDNLTKRYPLNTENFIEYTFNANIPQGLQLTEFMASNTNTIQDEADEYEDWVELYNSSDEAINLGGLYLTDKTDNFTKFTMPDTVLNAKSYVIVWLDEDGSQGPLHANFKLSKGGEFIGLFAGDGTTALDSLSFGEQADDVSFGRNSEGNWVALDVPSPGFSNVPTSIENDFTEKPFEARISSVYPNPFNPQTTIQIELSSAESVNVSVFDILGRHVQSIVSSEMMKAGSYSFTMDGSNLASGIYMIQLRTHSVHQVKKVMLIK
ncbi:T9SS type A sorting domain-containing protein [bacterium]|nr:MAG: T9SS type A sorting domain-containing protein [bacterium]